MKKILLASILSLAVIAKTFACLVMLDDVNTYLDKTLMSEYSSINKAYFLNIYNAYNTLETVIEIPTADKEEDEDWDIEDNIFVSFSNDDNDYGNIYTREGNYDNKTYWRLFSGTAGTEETGYYSSFKIIGGEPYDWYFVKSAWDNKDTATRYYTNTTGEYPWEGEWTSINGGNVLYGDITVAQTENIATVNVALPLTIKVQLPTTVRSVYFPYGDNLTTAKLQYKNSTDDWVDIKEVDVSNITMADRPVAYFGTNVITEDDNVFTVDNSVMMRIYITDDVYENISTNDYTTGIEQVGSSGYLRYFTYFNPYYFYITIKENKRAN